jgi:hypothetical protein
MANGKPGDHPITDVMVHNSVVFGDPWDSEFRGILELLGFERAHDWFNTECWSKEDHAIRLAISKKLIALRQEARDRGWEPPA